MDNTQNLHKEIIKISVPSFLETLFNTFTGIIDSKMVSALGVSAISAVSVTNQPKLFIFSIFFALHTVTTSLVAKYYGKDDQVSANQVLDHVLKLVVLLSLGLGVLSVLLAKPIMMLFSGQQDTMENSILYFRIIMGGMIFNLLYMTINAALRGIGETKLTFADNVLSCAVNILFNYLLIEGHCGFPALGIKGAAIATVLGQAAALVMCILFLCRKQIFISLPFCLRQKYHMTLKGLNEIIEKTKSCAVDNLNMRLALLFISGITARIGSYQLAVYSVGNYLLNINYAMGTGLQTSGLTLIGRAWGKGDLELVTATRKTITKLGMTCAVILGIVIAAGGRPFFSFFSQDEEFIRIGTISAVLIGIITISQTLKFIYNGCLQGMGMMKQSMFCSIIAFTGVNLVSVLLTVLVFRMGIWGVWLSSFLSQTVQAAMLYYYVRHPEKHIPAGK